MSSTFIAVANVPSRVSLKECVKCLAKAIRGQFEAVHFVQAKDIKTVYLRLSPKLNPHEVAQRVTGQKLRSARVRAFVPDKLPNIPLTCKPRSIPKQLRRKLKIEPDLTKDTLVIYSFEHIMREIQTKFTGLYDLSHSSGHKLLIEIGKIVYERLNKITLTSPECDSCFKMTKMYRKRHPHFGDFQMILSTLHSIQDAEGKPRERILEKDLIAVPLLTYALDNIPMDKVHNVCNKHVTRITNKILQHVNNLDVTPENASDIDAARVRVRKQLKNLLPYLPSIVKHSITDHLMPPEHNAYIVKVYGEPFLPNKEMMLPFSRQHRIMSTIRSDRMFNLISFKVPKGAHMKLLAADGTLVAGAKLVIRPSNLRYYSVPTTFTMQLPVQDEAPVQGEEAMEQHDEGREEEEDMEWNEEW